MPGPSHKGKPNYLKPARLIREFLAGKANVSGGSASAIWGRAEPREEPTRESPNFTFRSALVFPTGKSEWAGDCRRIRVIP